MLVTLKILQDDFQNASYLKLALLAWGRGGRGGAAGAVTAEMFQCPEVSMR